MSGRAFGKSSVVAALVDLEKLKSRARKDSDHSSSGFLEFKGIFCLLFYFIRF